MIVENTRQDKIKNIIIKVANSTYGVTPEHIRKAVQKYIYDDRDIEIIEKELWELSRKIEEETRLREELNRRVNENQNTNVNTIPQNSATSIQNNTSFDNQLTDERQVKEEEFVNLQESTQNDTIDELSAMFSDNPPVTQHNINQQNQVEKANVLVKTQMSNNRGQATFLNLCFIFSTISILGMIISTIILYAQKLFN